MTLQEQLNERYFYDEETGQLFVRKNLVGPTSAEGQAGWIEEGPSMRYRRLSFYGKRYFVHNVIWCMLTGYMPHREIDHIDGNGLNNCISNLRLVNPQENMKNKRVYRNNKSGVPGVYWRGDRGNMWYATAGRKHIGSFASKEEAVLAREAALRDMGYHKNHGNRS